ncbi:hypothetical protein RIF29_10843 [Crotalaria pallida]|uniref:Uncharacterized protein n=1 Tax=Crotalaria pallida TaxID=3830 RepID=A0AAN9FZC1_CROPI
MFLRVSAVVGNQDEFQNFMLLRILMVLLQFEVELECKTEKKREHINEEEWKSSRNLDEPKIKKRCNSCWFGLCRIVNQRGQKSQQLHPRDQRRGYSEDIEMMPSLKYFLQNCRPVAKYYGHDVIEENDFDGIKYHAEENNTEDESEDDDDSFDGIKYHAEEKDTEDESEDDDDSLIADPQHKLFMENLRPDGNFYVYNIIKDNVFVRYHDEPSSPEPEDPTVIVIDDANHVSNDANVMDTAMHSPVMYEGKHRCTKPKFPKLDAYKSGNADDSHVASEAQKHEGKRRGRKPKGQDLSAHKNPNGNASSSRLALEPQNHALNFKGKRRGRELKGGSNLLANKNPIGNSNQVTSEGHDHAVKCEDRKRKWQDLSAEKNHKANASRNRVALEPQNHVLNYKGKHRGREPKGGSNLLANKNPIGNSNQVTLEGHDHAVKREDRKRKWHDLSAEKNHKANASRNRVALEPQNHVLNYKGKRRGREPKGGSNLLANKNPIGNSNQVTSEGHDHAVKREDRKRKWQDLSAEKNHKANASRNRVALEPQNHVLNYKGKHRGREPKGGSNLLANKNPIGNSNQVTLEGHDHAVKREDRKRKWHDLSAEKNHKANASRNRVALEPQNHVLNYKGKRRGREPKGGSNLLANKNPIGNSNQVTSERHDHAVKREDRKRKWQDLSAEKNHNANASRNRVALEPQNHVLNYKGMHRGRKPKGGSNLQATKNQVILEAHNHAVKLRGMKAKKNVVPSADCQTIDHEIKTDTEDDDDDDVPPCRRRPVRYSTLNEKIFLDDDDEANAAKPTEFREKLMEELKKPYCQAEYDRLLKNITVRKPAQGQKVLRRGTKVYEEDHNAKSYLDHHIDLKRKMYEVRDDKHKLLNLLRGFFYWLVNVPHEWKFKPWKVQSCLDVLPQQQ